MLRSLNTRFWIMIAVTVLSIIFVIPTIRYFAFVDSIGDRAMTIDEKKELGKLREKSIKLGLDLQGGVDFLLAVDSEKVQAAHMEKIADNIRRELADNKVPASVTTDNKAANIIVKLDDVKDTEIADKVLKKFESDFDNPDYGKLASGKTDLHVSNSVLTANLRETMDGALRVVRRRVDEFGLTQPVVTRQGADRIRVQIPGETDPEKIEKNLLRPATLEFRLLHPDMAQYTEPLCKPGTFSRQTGIGEIKDEYLKEVITETGGIRKVPADNLPGIPPGFKVLLGEDTRTDPNTHERVTRKNLVYLVKDKVEVRGDELKDAHPQVIQAALDNPYKVALEFNRDGARKFAKVTRENVEKPFAIILENVVYSAPIIKSPIPDGRCVIEGNFKLEDVRDLAQVLRAGALPAPLRPIEKRAVEASLGVDSIVDSVNALGIGAAILVVFLVIYYGRAGVVAVLAMLLNVLLILAFLSMAGATLTLSGIGGILLTMGMAIDANVLIYERMREELATKKPIKAAISTAFSRAFTVIFDSNITSILPALALLLFEVVEGSIKGFWITLTVGLIVNLYTGVTVTRALVETWVAVRGKFSVGQFTWFKEPKIAFMKLRPVGYGISIVLLVASMGYVAIHGVNWAVDFTGGVLAHVSVQKPLETQDIRAAMSRAGITGVAVQKVLNRNEFLIKEKVEQAAVSPEATAAAEAQLKTALNRELKDAGVQVLAVDSIAGEVGEEFQSIAIKCIIVASISILLYVGWRFQYVFALTALIALLFDVLAALGLYLMLGREVNMDIVSALLIILGYSVNDKIVIFDRIREVTGGNYGKNLRAMVDQAVNNCLNRTVNAGGGTIITIVVMIFFGGRGLADFALILLMGVLLGTYSSIFVATTLAYDWLEQRVKKEESMRQLARDSKGRSLQTAK